MKLINRDPFARVELHRRTVSECDRRPCQWCGRLARFAYHYEHDGGRRDPEHGVFCSIGCWRAYWA